MQMYVKRYYVLHSTIEKILLGREQELYEEYEKSPEASYLKFFSKKGLAGQVVR